MWGPTDTDRTPPPQALVLAVTPVKHPAMRSNEREIRLLTLLPGGRDDGVRCTTRVVSLDEHPVFETVSYVWGDRSGDVTIDVSGTPIAVTENLYAGLLRLRHETTERNLWIDQICINQWDLEEKAAQVALMRDIYRQCAQCVTWMGEIPNDHSDISQAASAAVFDFLRQSASAKDTPLSALPVMFQDSEAGVAAREAFAKFSMYGNPWWSRIWTVQEAIIPPSGLLLWGPLAISRETVLAAARNLRDLDSLPSLPEGFAACRHKHTELLRRLLYPVHGFRHSETDNPLDLLMRWRHRKFTDARDKVYGLLGLISPQALPSALSCDYTIAVPDLFAKVTSDLIKHEQGLRPLLGACELPHLTTNNPTWAIDLAQCNRIGKRQLKWWGHSHRYRVFSANGNHGLKLAESLDPNVLGLRGVCIDEVESTTELLRVNAHDPILFDELHEPISRCMRLLEQYKALEQVRDVYRDGFSWDSALCRTLVGDLIMDELPLGRIATLGRARLQSDFEELFNKLRIPLNREVGLDSIPFAAGEETECNSPTFPDYSPTSPNYSPSSPIVDTSFPSTSPVHEPSSPVYETPSPNHAPLPFCSPPPSPTRSPPALSIVPDYNPPPEPSIVPWWMSTPANRSSTSYSCSTRSRYQSECSNIDPYIRPNVRKWLARPVEGDFFVDLYESLVGMMENQTFFITKSGYIGIGPPYTSPGDQVWVFKGGNVPFVMRDASAEGKDQPQLTLVGDAYVHGIMDGEAMDNQSQMQCVHIL